MRTTLKTLDPYKWISLAVSKDETTRAHLMRPILCPDKDKLPEGFEFLAGGSFATDGHRLHATSKVVGGAKEGPPIGQVIPSGEIRASFRVDHDDLKWFKCAAGAIKAFKPFDGFPHLRLEISDGKIVATSRQSLRMECPRPKFRIDRNENLQEESIVVGVDANYLVDALSAMGRNGAQIEIRGELDPILIRSLPGEVPPWIAIVMPCRTDPPKGGAK